MKLDYFKFGEEKKKEGKKEKNKRKEKRRKKSKKETYEIFKTFFMERISSGTMFLRSDCALNTIFNFRFKLKVNSVARKISTNEIYHH